MSDIETLRRELEQEQSAVRHLNTVISTKDNELTWERSVVRRLEKALAECQARIGESYYEAMLINLKRIALDGRDSSKGHFCTARQKLDSIIATITNIQNETKVWK